MRRHADPPASNASTQQGVQAAARSQPVAPWPPWSCGGRRPGEPPRSCARWCACRPPAVRRARRDRPPSRLQARETKHGPRTCAYTGLSLGSSRWARLSMLHGPEPFVGQILARDVMGAHPTARRCPLLRLPPPQRPGTLGTACSTRRPPGSTGWPWAPPVGPPQSQTRRLQAAGGGARGQAAGVGRMGSAPTLPGRPCRTAANKLARSCHRPGDACMPPHSQAAAVLSHTLALHVSSCKGAPGEPPNPNPPTPTP